jgi:multiple sugar transport system permease protein/raffinose/stachyose/melibiose transport system permease protein
MTTTTRSGAKRSKAAWTALFVTPPLILYIAIVVLPTLLAFFYAFTDASILDQSMHWIGLENFREAFTDRHVLSSIKITLIWLAGAMVIPPAIGLFIALRLQQKDRIATTMKSALFLPVALSLVVVGQIWIWMYQPGDGLINVILNGIGLESVARGWLADRSFALIAVFIAWAWQQTILAMILYLAGLASLPTDLYEAAEIDGASKSQVTRYITIPLLRPITAVVVALISISALRNFDVIYATTKGGPVRATETLPVLVYRLLFREHQLGYSSAIAIILFAMTLALVGAITWWGNRGKYGD